MTTGQNGMKVSVRSIASTQLVELDDLARQPDRDAGYRWLETAEIPTVIPEALRRKFTSALLMWERTSTGGTYLICNGIRLDQRANALDQEPFGVVVHTSGPSPSGVLIHHGGWTDRTVTITPAIRSVLESTSVGNYFPLGEVPSSSGGALSDLKETSHHGAFRAVVRVLLSESA